MQTAPAVPLAELARRALVQPQSISARICRTGTFHGLIPRRLPNRRIVFDAAAVDRLFPSVVA